MGIQSNSRSDINNVVPFFHFKKEGGFVEWNGDEALIAGRVVGSVVQTSTGFRYEVTLQPGQIVASESRRRRDACRQVGIVCQRLLNKPSADQELFIEILFFQKVQDDLATAITADRLIRALAQKNGVDVRDLTSCYTGWRLSRGGGARDHRWANVKAMNVLDLIDDVKRSINELFWSE